MKIIYGTTNRAKLQAMYGIIKSYGFDAELYTILQQDFLQHLFKKLLIDTYLN